MRIIFFILFANLVVLDGVIVFNYLVKKEGQTQKAAATSIYTIDSKPTTDTVVEKPENCDQACQAEIAAAILDTLKLTPTAKPVTERLVIEKTAPTQTVQSQNQNTAAKEFFIPLGSGSTTSTEWTDIIGTKTEVNSNNYSSIKQVLFEATIRVPDANQIVEVRLYNETDKYVVDNSIFVYPSGTSENFRIASIQLGSGAKTYKVQIKTQLGYNAVLDQSRIHITTN